MPHIIGEVARHEVRHATGEGHFEKHLVIRIWQATREWFRGDGTTPFFYLFEEGLDIRGSKPELRAMEDVAVFRQYTAIMA